MSAKSGATFDYYQNADGSFTRKMSQSRINYKDDSGAWKSIDTRVTKGDDGRWHENANSLKVSFAPAAATGTAATSARQSALRGNGGSAVPAAFTSSLPWRTASAVQADDPAPSPDPAAGPGSSSQRDLATLTISGSESVSWSLAGANAVTGTASGSTVEYDGVLTDTNLVLSPTADGVKESLVLTSADAPTSWVFPMALKASP